ncbi:High Affinity Immunoglobulin Epsilon Receptor Subunit Alpha [Manis pentadactyla]|nr:High Affinity Immunoglobulin Epsilon Receptor Subunit Alpha [Manis pentadactyla]
MAEMPTLMGGPVLLWTALLFFAPENILSADPRKSVVSLSPPWNRIFREENVSLKCIVNNSIEDSPTQWTHNGIFLSKTSVLDIVNAQVSNSGEYRCQNREFMWSDPVSLQIFSDWLLLQASAEVVMEGEPLFIRCHSWKNRTTKKVTYYRNGEALKYWYENHDIYIANATANDNGIYYCTGFVWRINYTSIPLKITVMKASPFDQSKYYWTQLLIPFLVMILFAVDTGLLISTQKQFALLMKNKKTRNSGKLIEIQPESDP